MTNPAIAAHGLVKHDPGQGRGDARDGGMARRPAEHVVGRPRAGAVPVLALGRKQRGTGPLVVVAELGPRRPR